MLQFWGFHHYYYWGPRNTCKNKRELKHFLTELAPQIQWLQDDSSGCTHKCCKSVKSTQEVRLQLINLLFLLTFTSVHAWRLMLEVTVTLVRLFFPGCILCHSSQTEHLMKLIMAQIMFCWFFDSKIKRMVQWYNGTNQETNVLIQL